ncbi:putative oxidoreductase SSP0419 isoform X3 [Calliopsis andreniformis]|uniref:putative oxidoreductase SSP0419 isoform X3 n=1 Tax=Calliopsis andreniformis TaxID=337506 RepID=UPI003FCE0CC2
MNAWMLVLRDDAVNPRVTNPPASIWFFFTFEFLVGAALSGFLTILQVIKSLLPKPPRDLTGDVVVAGASSSLGESLAEEFVKSGCSVVCVDDSRSVEELASNLRTRLPEVEELRPKHRKDVLTQQRSMVSSYQCDLMDREEIRRTAKRIKNEIGRVDVLVTCVGNANQDIFDTASRTLMSHFWTVLAFLPLMLYRERAHIVGVTPVASTRDAYHGSKAAIVSLMETLCQELSDHSSYLTFLAFTPIAGRRSIKESEELTARDIVQAVKTDRYNLNWLSRVFYRLRDAIILHKSFVKKDSTDQNRLIVHRRKTIRVSYPKNGFRSCSIRTTSPFHIRIK